MNKLLTRKQFREFCLERDNFKCVVCKDDCDNSPHHLISEKLFKQPHELGGYFVDNGATLCNDCHLKAEFTLTSVEDLRKFAKITNIILPDHFEIGVKYDCWGNEILSNGQRLKGELFDDTGCQKALKEGNALGLFTNDLVSKKYNRTFHLPNSKGGTSDDKRMSDVSYLLNKPLIITEKIDGQNFSYEYENCYARTHSNIPNHPSCDWAKAYHGKVKYLIPKGYQIFLENSFALHSIKYNSLPSYCLIFNIRDLNKNIWLSWEEVEMWAEELKLPTVPVIGEFIFSSEKELVEITNKLAVQPSLVGGEDREGIVVRIKDQFDDKDFSKCVAKWVRVGHVVTDEHWKNKQIIKNKLK